MNLFVMCKHAVRRFLCGNIELEAEGGGKYSFAHFHVDHYFSKKIDHM
jgi:secreted Zn-dependent insulinase-like peptidase